MVIVPAGHKGFEVPPLCSVHAIINCLYHFLLGRGPSLGLNLGRRNSRQRNSIEITEVFIRPSLPAGQADFLGMSLLGVRMELYASKLGFSIWRW